MDCRCLSGAFERASRAGGAMKLLRIGLCLLFAFSVLALGAVEVWSQSIVEIGAAALFLWWALVAYRDSGAKIHWNPLHGPLLGLIGIGLLQLLFHGTAYPFLTRTMLLKLAAYFLVLFLTAQAFRARKDLSKLAWFVMAFCFAVSSARHHSALHLRVGDLLAAATSRLRAIHSART